MKRRWTHLIALLLALAVFAAGCGDDDDGGDDGGEDTAPETSAEVEGDDGGEDDDAAAEDGPTNTAPSGDEEMEPQSGGTLRVGLEAETDGLNPTVNRFAVSALQMGNAVFDTLASQTPTGEWVPYLAESFTPNDDFTTWDIKVREGISFHDGTPLNAEAIIANTEAQLADPLISLAVTAIFPEGENATKFEVIDEYTARFHMRRPTANFPAFLNTQLGMVASPQWLAAAQENQQLNQQPVGTGPFMFDSRTPDSVTRFVRNDDWWNGEAYLDAIEFYPITDSEVSANQLLQGDLDSIGTTNIDAILTMRDAGDDLTLIEEDLGEESFAMINTDQPPFDDIRARQALTFATPRQDYIDFVGQGELREADSMFAPELPWYNPDVEQEGDIPDQAAPLVEEYCAEFAQNCTDGRIDMEFQYSGPSQLQDRIADVLEDGWSQFFNVERDVLLQDDHITQVALGDYNVVTWRQFGALDPDSDSVWLTCESIAGLSLNWPRYCDPERDEQLFEQRASQDQDVRVAAWQEVAALMNEAYTYIFFTHTLWTNAFADNVHGMCDATAPDSDELLYCTLNGRHLHHTIWLEQ